MAIYQSRAVQERRPVPVHGLGNSLYCDRFVVTVPAPLLAGDRIEFGYVPKFASIRSAVLKASDMDGGSLLTLNVGDEGDGSRLFAGSNVAQTGSAQWTVGGFRYGEEELIVGSVASAPASGVAGTIDLLVMYTVADPGMYDFTSLIRDTLIGENGEPLFGLDTVDLVGAL